MSRKGGGQPRLSRPVLEGGVNHTESHGPALELQLPGLKMEAFLGGNIDYPRTMVLTVSGSRSYSDCHDKEQKTPPLPLRLSPPLERRVQKTEWVPAGPYSPQPLSHEPP